MIEEILQAKNVDIGFDLTNCIEYQTVMGSLTYGAANEFSDTDIYGICIPPKELVFPHTAGFIEEFDQEKKIFSDYQQTHIEHKSKIYDIFIYAITKFFRLCLQNNPNILDSLYTDEEYILNSTKIGNSIRENRSLFLHQGLCDKYIGYAHSQMSKLKKISESLQNRKHLDIHKRSSYDVKFAYHTVRLLNEAEQLLSDQNMNLKRNSDLLRTVRSGEWSFSQLEQYTTEKKKLLSTLKETTKLPKVPRTKEVKSLLLQCLEEKYGSLQNCVIYEDRKNEI